MVELRDVFEFPSFLPSTTTKTRSRTPPRASFFSFSFRRKPPDEALGRVRFTYFAKRALAASGQIIPRFVESGAPFRRRRRRLDAVSYFIAILAPKDALFRKVRAFSPKKRQKKEKKRRISRFFYSGAFFRRSVRRAAVFFSLVGVKLAVAASASVLRRFSRRERPKKTVARSSGNIRRSLDRSFRKRNAFPFCPISLFLYFAAKILVVSRNVTRRLSANFLFFVSGDDRAMNLFPTSRINRMNDVDVLFIRGEIGNGGGSVF